MKREGRDAEMGRAFDDLALMFISDLKSEIAVYLTREHADVPSIVKMMLMSLNAIGGTCMCRWCHVCI